MILFLIGGILFSEETPRRDRKVDYSSVFGRNNHGAHHDIDIAIAAGVGDLGPPLQIAR